VPEIVEGPRENCKWGIKFGAVQGEVRGGRRKKVPKSKK